MHRPVLQDASAGHYKILVTIPYSFENENYRISTLATVLLIAPRVNTNAIAQLLKGRSLKRTTDIAWTLPTRGR